MRLTHYVMEGGLGSQRMMKRLREVASDPYGFFVVYIIIDALKIVRGEVADTTEKDRCEAIYFLKGPKCARWFELLGVDHTEMVREVFGEEGENGNLSIDKVSRMCYDVND